MVYVKNFISAGIAFILVLALFIGCGDSKTPKIGSGSRETPSNPLIVDEKNKTVTFMARVNGKYFVEPTRHCAVFKDGSNGSKSIFTSMAGHAEFYDALKKIGGKSGDNMTMENKEKTSVSGDSLDITVTWDGAPKAYRLDEVVRDSNKKPMEMKFGGNIKMANDKNSGCLMCLDSCPVGIVSNSAYTYGAVEKRKEVAFTGNREVLPPDGTMVSITVKVK